MPRWISRARFLLDLPRRPFANDGSFGFLPIDSVGEERRTCCWLVRHVCACGEHSPVRASARVGGAGGDRAKPVCRHYSLGRDFNPLGVPAARRSRRSTPVPPPPRPSLPFQHSGRGCPPALLSLLPSWGRVERSSGPTLGNRCPAVWRKSDRASPRSLDLPRVLCPLGRRCRRGSSRPYPPTFSVVLFFFEFIRPAPARSTSAASTPVPPPTTGRGERAVARATERKGRGGGATRVVGRRCLDVGWWAAGAPRLGVWQR